VLNGLIESGQMVFNFLSHCCDVPTIDGLINWTMEDFIPAGCPNQQHQNMHTHFC